MLDRNGEKHMQLDNRYKTVDENGIGKCSVPTGWSYGGPVFFCGEPAYGEPARCKMYRDAHGQYNSYVRGLACPAHGGPTSRVFLDGDAWCAVYPDFVDLQESLAGFGDTPELARIDLEKRRSEKLRCADG